MMRLIGLPTDTKDLIALAKDNFQKYDKNKDSDLSLDETLKMSADLAAFLRITTSMNFELNKKMVGAIFFVLDENNNGKLSSDEGKRFADNLKKGKIIELLENFALNKLSYLGGAVGIPMNMKELIAFQKTNFQKYDKNEDAQLSQKETLEMLEDLASFLRKTTPISSELNGKDLEMIFFVLDENNNGQISADEIGKVTENAVDGHIGELLKNVAFNKLFRYMDKDLDGFITKMDIDNVIKSCSKLTKIANGFKPMVRIMVIYSLFGIVDENQDNKLTRTEILNASIFKQ